MLKACAIYLLLMLLTACSAAAPVSNSKLESTRQAVARAYAEGGAEFAPGDYRLAKLKLSAGEEYLRQGEEDKADLVLMQASYFAGRAREKARSSRDETQAKANSFSSSPLSIYGVKPAPDTEPDPVDQEPLEEAEVSYLQAGSRPVTTSKPPVKQKRASSSEVRLKEYVVKDGETLWTIAALRSVYRDALLWPLLYKANRDQIKDPRQIFPQQVLMIPRGASEQEMQEAREKARRSEIFPLDVLLRQVADGEK